MINLVNFRYIVEFLRGLILASDKRIPSSHFLKFSIKFKNLLEYEFPFRFMSVIFNLVY